MNRFLTLILCAASACAAAAADLSRTMCLGDSITHFGYTEYYLQLFENLRHPGSGRRYYNAGYSGGLVSTGLTHWEHERARIRPDRVSMMFGMNDVLWTTFETNAVLSAERKSAVDKALARYGNDYRTLVDRIRQSGVTNVVLVTPPPYDEYSVQLASPRRRNVNAYGLTQAARIVREVAAEKGVPVVDVHAAMTALCAQFPDRGLCGGDRVHPPRLGHLFMAFQYLAAERDRPVASVAVAADGTVVRTDNAAVTNVRAADGVLAFDYRPKALPLPPLEELRELKAIWPDVDRFNRETLKVAGLSAAYRWSLRAEGRELGVFSAADLAAGVNLADLDTPGRRLAAQAAAAMTALHDFDRSRRDRACLRLRFESLGVPMTDKAALKAAYDKHLDELKAMKAHWYEWEKAAAADFLNAMGREREIAAEEDRLYRAIAEVRPVRCRLSLVPVKPDGTAAAGSSLDTLDYEALVARAQKGPTLLFTAAMRDAARKRIAEDPVARTWWTDFKADLDKRLAAVPAMPPVGGQWYHWYACPKCGVQLKGETPTRHVCRKCKGVYSGWPYDDAYYFFVHHKLGNLVKDCGLAGALTGEKKYVDAVRSILLDYAKVYLTYPRHDNSGPNDRNWDAARTFSQILDESVWLINLLQGYDAVASEISEADRRLLREKLFRPSADLIYARDDAPRHILGNHQCWHFSAYALAALVTGDAARLRESMEGLSGCRYQLEAGILSDGFWFEGAWGYHFYTMSSLMPYFTALGNLGVRPPALFKKMFDAPFGQLTPDWKLPAMNDSARVGFAPGTNAQFYEQAWSWWRDETYAGWLALKPRTTLHYALYGSPLPAQGRKLDLKSRLYDASGVAVLREKGNYVLMDYGPHGGWHGHYDKLNLLVWADGDMFAEDPGCVGYGLPLHWGWYRKSLAHNTLSVDGGQAAADGKLLGFGKTNGVQYVLADAGVIAKGVQARRATALCGNLVFDYVAATSVDEHLYEWSFHSRGALETSVEGKSVPTKRPDIVCKKQKDADLLASKTDPWSWTTDCREGTHAGDWSAKWTLANGKTLSLFQHAPAGSLRSATGGAQPPSQSLRLIANRVTGRTAAFASVLLLNAAGPATVESLETKDGAPGFVARVGGRSYYCRIAPDWTSMSVEVHDTRAADRAAEGHVCEVNIPWHFPSNRVDWLFNPTKAKPPFNPEWTWQLNRTGSWKTLADAYLDTRDEKYARAFAVQLRDWLDQTGGTPPEKGFNGHGSPWRTIEEGIRLMGPWTPVYAAFKDSPSLPADLRERFLASMRAQAKHLMAHRTATGNWLLMEMNGVYTFACRFPELPESAAMRRESAAILAAAIRDQVLPDGLHYELSPDYHLVFYICAAQIYQLARETGFAGELPPDFASILERGADGYVKMMAPGFVQPRFNDCYTMYTKRVLATASKLFPARKDFLWAATEGRQGVAPSSEPTASRYLPYSGFAVMRSDWSRDAAFLAFDVGPLGMGHWHQDKLSFTLWKGGEELVFDDGGGQYENSAFRTYALSGYDHNTLLVDGLAQNRREPKMVTEPIDAGWTTTPERDRARGTYDQGFGPDRRTLAKQVRDIVFEKKDELFRVTDAVTSADGQAHDYALLFHVDTTNVVVAADGRSLVARFGRKWDLEMVVERGGTIALQSGVEKPRLAGWFVGRNDLDVHRATTISVTAPKANDATFVTTFRPVPARSEPAAPSSLTPQMGVLTPPAGAAPRINGPRVFGVRPGHPVLWRIPVTGARPVSVDVKGLPAGVAYDPARNMLVGACAARGAYDLAVTARNAEGAATRTLTLKVGDAICLTPPMGWNSWNCWGQEVSDEKVRRAADALASTGLADHGWNYVVVDDCWRTRPTELQAGFKRPDWIGDKPHMPGPARFEDGTPRTNPWFPDMKAMADHIHAKGLRAGLYSVPSDVACCYTWGSWGHEETDARTWAAWGYDLVKYDWCYGDRHFPGKGSRQDWQIDRFTLMGGLLARQSRDMVYNVCQYGRLDVTKWAKRTGAHYWRTNDDLKDAWPLLLRCVDENLKVADAAGPDGWNDPDMLVVGPMRSNGFTTSRLTPNEQYTHLSLWAIMASPLFIGCDLERLPKDPLAWSLLTNDEVIDIDQDELGKVGRPVVHTDRHDVWARPLANGDWAVALFNRTAEPREIAARFADFGVAGEWTVRDVWAQKDLGAFRDAFTQPVYGHATRLFRLRRN